MELSTSIKILLVEDANAMRKMEIKTLSSLDFKNVLEADSGVTAIKILEKEKDVALIISDWNMPEMDGFELLKWVRTNEATKAVPFLMATGRGEKKEVEKALEAGVSAFISKPFNNVELLDKIKEAFGINQPETEALSYDRESKITASGKVKIKAIHIQITDHLTLGVLKGLIKNGEITPKTFELETECLASWNAVAKALENKSADAAFISAPLAMDLYNFGVPLKLILFAHKNGSICVHNKFIDEEKGAEFFRNKSFYIPHTMSVHNMLGHAFFNNIGLKPGVSGQKNVDVNFEVVAPVKMQEFMSGNQEASGFLVAEPLGTKAIAAGVAELQFLSSELWENHPCCVLAVQQEFIDNFPDAVHEFVKHLVQAGKLIDEKPNFAAEIGVEFLDPKKELGLKVPILKNVLTEPKGIKTNNLYPVKGDLDFIQHYMHDQMGIGSIINLNEFVDTRFADSVCTDKEKSQAKSRINEKEIAANVHKVMNRSQKGSGGLETKSLLNLEGKYLRFILGEERYGIDIIKIIEIIKTVPITRVPNTPDYIKGVINLRGMIVPVIDMRKKIGLPEVEFTSKTRIVVVEDVIESANIRIGLIVDEVDMVCDVKVNQIDSVPSLGQEGTADYLLAVVKAEGFIYCLLNLPLLMRPPHFDPPKSK